jgi:hypothetical protein
MHISFTAIEASFEFDEYTIIANVEGTDNILVFQRDSEQNFEDSGLYIQFGDQHNGEYECVEFCCLSRKILQVSLSRQLGSLEGVTGFDIKLEINDESYNHLLEGLPRIFREMPNYLKID